MGVKQESVEKPLDLLNRKVEMPRLTGVSGELLSIMHMPLAQIEMRRIVSLAESDPTLTASVLRSANSAYFGALREIKTVSQAITRMGFEDTIHILSYHCLSGLMPAPKNLPNFSSKEFWLHSWATATVARMLGKPQYLLRSLPGELYSAGLLHDIGKIVLAGYAGESFDQACAIARGQRIPIHEAEMQVMGLDHAKLGGQVLDDWNLPLPILNAVRGHHELSEASADGNEITKLIELADAIAYFCGFPDGSGQPARDPMQTAILKEERSPLSTPKIFKRLLDDASTALAEKSRILYKPETPERREEENRSAEPRGTRKHTVLHRQPEAQRPGFWGWIASCARQFFGI